MTTITVVNSGTGSYTINGVGSNPTISLVRGNTYNLVINASGHPFWIQTVSGAYSSSNIYSSGVTNNGSQSDTITFVVPNDAPNTLYYACEFHSSMQGTITITDPASPTITNFSIPILTYSNGATFTIFPPTSNSAGAFSYASADTNIATVSGSIINILQAGTTTITATQSANGIYTSGTATATLTIQEPPTITNFSIPAQTYSNGGTFTITQPTSNSAGAFSYASSNTSIATVSGSIVTILQVGSVTITATQTSSGIYTSGTATATLTIGSGAPTITNFSIPNQAYSNGATFTITQPTSNSVGAFSYASSNTSMVTISGAIVTILQAGTTSITATQSANGNFTSGTVATTLTINEPKYEGNIIAKYCAKSTCENSLVQKGTKRADTSGNSTQISKAMRYSQYVRKY